jgi:hypothetical protein
MTPSDIFTEMLRFWACSPFDILDEVCAVDRRIIRDGQRAAQGSIEAMNEGHLIFSYPRVTAL